MPPESPADAAVPGSQDLCTKRRLAELIAPARRDLQLAGTLQSFRIAATAAEFFAVAQVAQNVLNRDVGWGHDLRWLGLLVAGAMVRSIAGYLAADRAAAAALATERHLQQRLLGALIAGRGAALTSGERATAVIEEVERVATYAERYAPARIAALLAPLILLAAAFSQNWVVGVLLLVCAPLPPLNLSIVGMGAADAARRHGEELRHLSGYLLDRLRGLATLRALGADQAELQRVRRASEALVTSSMTVLRVAFVSAAALEGIVTICMAIVAIYVGLTLLDYVSVPGLPAHMSLAAGLFLLMLTPLYFQPVRSLASAYHERADALAAADALATLLVGETVDLAAGPTLAVGQRLRRAPVIEIEELTVRFDGREGPVIDELSVDIDSGELVGLTGVSGAGKSTLLRVLAGELEPTSGSVLLDGLKLAQVLPSELKWLGQRPYLFSGSIGANIALDERADHDAILTAAISAGLGPLLGRLPGGLDTPVSELGWGISGGEAHRIALARTLLRPSPVLLLDEPTAHLDSESEAAVMEVLEDLARTATTIVASHSPAVLVACDRVLTLDRGRLTPSPVVASTVAAPR